jgi:hypothetical protein
MGHAEVERAALAVPVTRVADSEARMKYAVIDTETTGLRVVPITLRGANELVSKLHRHHKPARGCRFCVAIEDDSGKLRGVAIVGRPVARMVDHRKVAEVTRVATDGVRNGCSMLLGSAARAAKALGYDQIQTYTLPAEGGASLRGAGWTNAGQTEGGDWSRAARPRQKILRRDG